MELTFTLVGEKILALKVFKENEKYRSCASFEKSLLLTFEYENL